MAIDKLSTTKTLLGITDQEQDNLVNIFLDIAQQHYMRLRYGSSDKFPTDINGDIIYPTGDFESLWECRAAVELYNRMGSEGELSHSSSVSRQYESSDLSKGLRQQVVRIGTVVNK